MEWITTERNSQPESAPPADGSGDSRWADQPFMNTAGKRCEEFLACAATTIARRAAAEKLKRSSSSHVMYQLRDQS